jgi:hypothetical protein
MEVPMTDDPTAAPEPDARSGAESATPEPPTDPSGPSASEAWADVVARMSELGAAVTTWTRAAADNPENRRRLEDVRNGVNDMAKQADAAVSRVTSTDVGQQVKSGAGEVGQAIGDAAQKVSDAAAPHVATAFAGLASAFGRASHMVEEAAARQKAAAASPPAEAATQESAPDTTPPAPPTPPTTGE